jgi:hypothetical protein
MGERETILRYSYGKSYIGIIYDSRVEFVVTDYR